MITETVKKCIVCGARGFREHFECKDHFVSGEKFKLAVCETCGFCFTNPRSPIDQISPYYESDAYVSHSKTSSGITNRLFHLSRNYTISYKKRILKKYTSGNTILDYGCGTGDFLNAMDRAGWDCSGIEPNEGARNQASQNKSLAITDEAGLSDIPDGSLDAISLWHVLEHIYPISERLSSFHEKLSPDGTLFVALPNMNSYDARRYGSYWAAFDVPRHIYHFTPESINTLMKEHGFDMIASRPMLLDAFYISMLSEKYKSGRSKIIQAGLTGLLSNIQASVKGRNYSSLIYIFKKSK
ncbi:MAG: class I SAM-dependent methyltransferase [Bacteroidales bacterium]|nr:class I SAM-dependent methyltransferase [Bacteroidales bacterium]